MLTFINIGLLLLCLLFVIKFTFYIYYTYIAMNNTFVVYIHMFIYHILNTYRYICHISYIYICYIHYNYN